MTDSNDNKYRVSLAGSDRYPVIVYEDSYFEALKINHDHIPAKGKENKIEGPVEGLTRKTLVRTRSI